MENMAQQVLAQDLTLTRLLQEMERGQVGPEH
jgi:hypothetical protein